MCDMWCMILLYKVVKIRYLVTLLTHQHQLKSYYYWKQLKSYYWKQIFLLLCFSILYTMCVVKTRNLIRQIEIKGILVFLLLLLLLLQLYQYIDKKKLPLNILLYWSWGAERRQVRGGSRNSFNARTKSFKHASNSLKFNACEHSFLVLFEPDLL